MKNHKNIACMVSGALMFAIVLILFHQSRPRSGDTADFGAVSSIEDAARPLPPEIPALPNRGSAPLSVIEQDARLSVIDAAVKKNFAWMKDQLAATPVANLPAMKPIRQRKVPENLVPKHAPLHARQVKALNKLRWNTAGKWVEYRTSPNRSTITYLKGRQLERRADQAEPGRSLEETTARQFLRRNEELLLLADSDDSLKLKSEETDDLGYTQLRFATNYKGLKVWPSALTIQMDPAGNVGLLTGAYAPHPDGLDIEPQVPAERARLVAKKGVGASPLTPVLGHELQVYAPIEESSSKLAWRVEVKTSVTEHWDVFVDAKNGEILHRENCVCTAHVQGSGVDLAGNTRPLNLWSHTDGGYYMVDTTKPMYQPGVSTPPQQTVGGITILRAPNANVVNGDIKDIGDVLLSASGSPNSGFSPGSVSASYHISLVYDFYLTRFNRNSIDGQGGGILAIVDIPNFDNAFWNSKSGLMAYGTVQDWPQALDITAHEMTHGVISKTSDLVYKEQSGALNESFADILGEGCEAHVRGALTDWTIMDIFPVLYRRSLSDPSSISLGNSNNRYPSRMSEFYKLPLESDHGGVHINSSIHNHAFYQLAAGLPGAIGLDDALAIFYRAVTTKLNPNSQFIDSRLGCVTSAEELFGVGSPQAQRTGQAFDYVEIYDQTGTPGERPIPVVTSTDSTLFIFPSNGQMYLGRREVAFGDGSAGVFLGNNGQPTTCAPGKKPAVAGNGELAVFVTPNFDAATINTTTGVVSAFGLTNQIESVSVSADGSTLAFVLRNGGQPSREIYVYDSTSGTSTTYEAKQPVTDQEGSGNSSGILFVDALDLSPDGRFVYYDALNRFILPGGFFIDNWSTYFIDRSANRVFDLFPPIASIGIGNPSIGQTRSNIITFDVQDQNGSYWVYATNRDDGQIKPVALLSGGTQVGAGWPGYSGDDSAIVYTDYYFDQNLFQWIPVLATIPIASDGITPTGANVAWLQGSYPNIGTIYRRGNWQGLPMVAVSTIANATEGGSSGCFRISRTNDNGSTPLTVGFNLIGTARNGVDFDAVPLTATIPAGASFVEIMIDPVDDSDGEGEEEVALSLSDFVDYRITTASSSVTIGDNDAVAGFAAWAAANGIGGSDYGGNSDTDIWTHLEEYALGLDPYQADGENAITARITGGRMVIDVLRTRKDDITYTMEFSDTMKSGTWSSSQSTVISDTASLFSVRSDRVLNGELFGRLHIEKQ